MIHLVWTPYAFSQSLVCPNLFIDAFVLYHKTSPDPTVVRLSYDCSYLTVILNGGLPNQKSLFWPCERVKTTPSVRDGFISSLFSEKSLCSRLTWPRKPLGLYVTLWLNGATVM